MANTREIMGDQAMLDAIIARTISGAVEDDSVSSIVDYAFHGCAGITSIKFPNAARIGQYAFAYCTSLTAVDADDLPLATGGTGAFLGCTSLETASLPEATTGYQIFNGCTSLVSAYVPKASGSISKAFYNCEALENVDVSSASSGGNTSTGSESFANCLALRSLVMPAMTLFYAYFFVNCPLLETIDTSLKFQVTSVGNTDTRSLPALRNFVTRYTGSGTAGLSNYLYGKSPIRVREGAVFVPQAKLAEYQTTYYWLTILPIETRYPVVNSDYSTITDSWAEIIAAEGDGTYLTKYALGDTKKFTIDGETFYAVLVAFDADNKADGTGKAHITWMVNRVAEARSFTGHYSSTIKNWSTMEWRTHLAEDILSEMDIAGYIVPVTKITQVSEGYVISDETTTDSLWLPSERELTGAEQETEADYDYTGYFLSNRATLRVRINSDTYASAVYLLRSNTGGNWRAINTSGNAANASTGLSAFGLVFGFCT